MTPTNAEVQDLLGNPEVVEALAAGLAGELLKHKREVIRLQAALETTTLEAREAEARADQVTGELCDVQGENAALRARAVPAIEWHKSPTKRDIHNANVGRLLLTAWRGLDGGYGWCIAHGHGFEDDIADGDADSIDDAKSKCEAAFLRLVGIQ
jgi:hypothetical protein